jgi:hypothetical protein
MVVTSERIALNMFVVGEGWAGIQSAQARIRPPVSTGGPKCYEGRSKSVARERSPRQKRAVWQMSQRTVPTSVAKFPGAHHATDWAV